MGRIGHIYTLRCPISGEVRYVGKTVAKPSKRLNDHICHAKLYGRTYCHRWILSVLSQGLRPVIAVESSLPVEELSKAEIESITQHKASGARLTNLTLGGEGCVGRVVSEVSRAKLSATYEANPELRERQSKTSKEAYASDPNHPLRLHAPAGENHPLSKLTETAVREILATPREQASDGALAKKYGVSRPSISNVRKGHTWKSVWDEVNQ